MAPRNEIRRGAMYLGWDSPRIVDDVRILFGDTSPTVWWTDLRGRSGRCRLSYFASRATESTQCPRCPKVGEPLPDDHPEAIKARYKAQGDHNLKVYRRATESKDAR